MTLDFLTNEADATFEDQAEPDAIDFQILLLGHQRTGVLDGCVVTEANPSGEFIDVTFGEVLLNGSLIRVSAQNGIAITAPDGTNPRFDLVTVNSSGIVVVTDGTAAADPAYPTIPDDSVPLAGIYLPADSFVASSLSDETKTVDDAGGAGDVVFSLPPGVVTGTDILLLITNTSDRNVITVDAGDANWTFLTGSVSEPPVKITAIAHTLTEADNKTQVTADMSGGGNIYCFAYIIKGADITDNSVQPDDIANTFNQYAIDLNSGNTNAKLWVSITVKNQTGLIPIAGAYDYSDYQVHDETQSSPAMSIQISAYASSDQTNFRLISGGPPHWPYLDKATNEQLAILTMEFASAALVLDNQINDKRVILQKSTPDLIRVFDLLNSTKITADTLDDEFEVLALDPKWTVVSGAAGIVDPLSRTNQAIYDLTTRPGWLLMQVGNDGSQEVNLRQDLTLADGQSVVMACAVNFNIGSSRNPTSNIIRVGLGLNTSTTVIEPANTLSLVWLAEADPGGMDIQGNSKTAGAADVGNGQTYLPNAPGVMFARIFRDGTDYHMFYSMDGVAWTSLQAAGSGAVGTVLDKLWISVLNVASSTSEPVPIVAFKWIRQGGGKNDPWDPYIDVGSSGHLILDEGISVPQRARLNFTGAGVTVADELTGQLEYNEEALALDPYLHWVMDDVTGNLADTSGHARSGVQTGNATYEQADSGVSSSPLSILFDGTDDDYTISYDVNLEVNTTVIVWYKGTDTNAGLFSLGKASSAKAWDVIIDANGYVQIRNVPSYVATTGTGTVDDGVWHMIALTVAPSNGGLNRLYVDGILEATQTLVGEEGSPFFTLGEVRSLSNVIGLLNFCTIYDDELSQNDIQFLYAARDITGEERWTTVAIGDSRPADETVHVDDDEFDGTDKAGWTELVVSGTATWTEGQGVMSVAFEDQSPEDFVVLGKAITTATLPITIETWVGGWLAYELGLAHIGIFFSDGLTDTDSQVTSVVSFGSQPGLNINNGTFTAHTGVAGGYTFQESGLMHGLGMRLIWTAANTWKALYSIDGVTWVDLEGAESVTMTPTSFGLMVSSWDADTKINLASFEYFRVTDADLSL